MYKKKTQTQRIIDTFVTVVVMITAVMLIVSGIAISKINTDYIESGIRAGKIVAERENAQISVTTHDGVSISGDKNFLQTLDKVLTLLPPPVNTTYLTVKEILNAK